MRRFSFATLLSLLSALPLAGADKPPKPCAGAEFRQFDFWVGKWDVTLPDGKKAGSNVITSVYGGCALHEEWSGASGVRGGSFSTYDGATGKWHQTWVDSGGTLLLMDGEFRDGKMQMEGRSRAKDSRVVDRVPWTPLSARTVRQFWEQSKEGGATWQVVFDGLYTKRK